MRQVKNKLDELDIRVKVVTFDTDVMALSYVEKTGLDWPLLQDDRQELYDAYGMSRGSWWRIWRPSSIWKYLKLMAGGQKPGKPGSDWRQLGGDILIDPGGIVQLHFVSSNPHDRPEIESIISIVENAQTKTTDSPAP